MTDSDNHSVLLLRDMIETHGRLMSERLAAMAEQLDEIERQTKLTNGRVNVLEHSAAIDAAVAVALASSTEAIRVTRAARLASRAWAKPVVGGGATALVVTAVSAWLGLK